KETLHTPTHPTTGEGHRVTGPKQTWLEENQTRAVEFSRNNHTTRTSPENPKRIPDRSSEEGASAFPLCCVFTLAAAPNTHQIGAHSKMVCHHGMKNPPPPVTLTAFYDPSPPGSSSSLPDPRSTQAMSIEEDVCRTWSGS